MKRIPAVQGRFYPNTKDSIYQLIKDIENKNTKNNLPEKGRDAIGAILPHAGHVYSAYQTIPFFKHLINNKIFPETFIILHPNHAGIGPEITLDENSAWVNCIGEISLDNELNDLLPYPADARVMKNEHSAEVLIPFIQYYFTDHPVQILPICLKGISVEKAMELAVNIYRAVKMTGRSVVVLASSDFSHFLTPDNGRKKDDLVLKEIYKRDIVALDKLVRTHHISVCGYSSIMSLMAYAEHVEHDYKTCLLARGHSGEVYPSMEVVNYISILFHSNS